MILLNFAYPLTQDQTTAIEDLLSQEITRIDTIPVDLDNDQPFEVQVEAVLASLDVPVEDLMTHPVAVILPSHAFIAALVLVGLQGRIGRFPAIIRFKPKPESIPISYELAEVADLQQLRDEIRQKRSTAG